MGFGPQGLGVETSNLNVYEGTLDLYPVRGNPF